MEYTSRGVGNAALTTGIIGTSLGAINSAGGLAGILGVSPKGNVPPPDPGDRPVTRYEMGLFKEIAEKNDEIVLLKANQYTDNKAGVLQAQISEQAAWNAAATATMGNIAGQIQQLFGITKLMVPSVNIAVPPVTQTPTVSGDTASAATGG